MLVRRALAAGALVLMLLGSLPARAQVAAWYFPATGHHLTDAQGFWSFWQAHDGARLLGAPVTEVLEVDGRQVQYFERARLEQQIDPDSGAASVQTGPVALEYAEALWRRFPAAPPRASKAGAQVFENGHTLRGPFLQFWQAAGGLELFGAPISEPLWEVTERGQRQVQYFERVRLERNAALAGTPDEIAVGDLGRALALLRGVDTAPVPNWGAETYGPPPAPSPDVGLLRIPTATPVPPTPPPATPVPTAPPAASRPAAGRPAPVAPGGPKRIVINLSDQWLYAYEGETLVFDAPVSTGRDGMQTPTGSYAVYTKLRSQTMDGVTDGEYWVVPDVPHVMYFNGDVAMHGTYWHNKFGTGARLSHGCVNLPLRSAAWLYSWAPVGTPVRVTY